jgi:hypothetical protein
MYLLHTTQRENTKFSERNLTSTKNNSDILIIVDMFVKKLFTHMNITDL